MFFFSVLICIRLSVNFFGYALMVDGFIVVGTVSHWAEFLFMYWCLDTMLVDGGKVDFLHLNVSEK